MWQKLKKWWILKSIKNQRSYLNLQISIQEISYTYYLEEMERLDKKQLSL